MEIEIKEIEKGYYLVNDKPVNTLLPKWGGNLTNSEYKALLKFRELKKLEGGDV